MRTGLQRMEQALEEDSNGHQLVDWTPGQEEGLGTRFAWPALGVLRKKAGERNMSSLKGEWLYPPRC